MAKNITTFAPGMAGSVPIGRNLWYNEIVRPMQGCTHRCGPRNPDLGSANHVWKFPTNTGYNGAAPEAKPISQAKLWMVNPGSNGGGGNCCGWGPPGQSGSKAVFDLNLTATNPDERCIVLCVPNGGCCVADLGGQQSCRWRVLNHDQSKFLFTFTTATCGCWICEFYTSAVCNSSCYVGGNDPNNKARYWDACCTCSGSDIYYCAPESSCHVADRQYLQADSDVNMFKGQVGYAMGGCNQEQARNKTMVFPINHWCTTKAHYVGVKGLGYDCNNNGGTLMCGFAKIWGGTNQSYGRGGICEQGVPGIPAVAGGGNCYCGGSGGAGTYMFWYK